MHTIRYFTYCYDTENDVDIVECTEQTFIDLNSDDLGTISYERHTVFDNGVNQVCLTIEPNNLPLQNEVQL